MKRTIKITESDIKNVVKNILKEISYGRASDAADNLRLDRTSPKGNDFLELKERFDDFYDILLENFGYITYPTNSTFVRNPDFGHNNKYIAEIMEHASAINDILERKANQTENIKDRLDNFDRKAYWNSEEGQEEDYEDKDLNYLINKYPRR